MFNFHTPLILNIHRIYKTFSLVYSSDVSYLTLTSDVDTTHLFTRSLNKQWITFFLACEKWQTFHSWHQKKTLASVIVQFWLTLKGGELTRKELLSHWQLQSQFQQKCWSSKNKLLNKLRWHWTLEEVKYFPKLILQQ